MKIPFFTLLVIGFSTLLHVLPVEKDQYFLKGKQFYKQRAENAKGFKAPANNIDSAIFYLKLAVEHHQHKRKAAVLLLQSYDFKGTWTSLKKEEQEKVFERGKDFGKKMRTEFDESVAIKYWYLVNLGRWGHSIGVLKAATKNIAKRMRTGCKEIIKQHPAYAHGGGYRILGAMNLKVPHIPLLLTWPSDDDAVQLLKKACALGKHNVANFVLYAQALKEENKQAAAIDVLEKIVDRNPRKADYLPDKYYLHRARKLLREWK